MIGRLRGILVEKNPPGLLVDVAGVGYELEAPATTFQRLPEIGEEITLSTHFVVREDAQLLYGFSDKSERQLFRTLIRVNGVGPKLALAILSGMEAEMFARCVHEQDTSMLTRLPGVGKKTAERLIVEMKDRLDEWQPALMPLEAAASKPAAFAARHDPVQDAISALIALGYRPQEASKAITAVEADGASTDDLIRQALKAMA
ncbi:Holliday junction branch migration protein RuvA [Sansalvadorimonas sp. 2012CJ34-2]|uniref:Holliday junction branch migration complex subunit RuvA n=1 Tax=Parendozoicomonas callyspongiae TaxID=2942213 RepID=A0ABT0PFT2_9GAMM|nr:Holliday junction branch migration protein RuvA [Sansalvadorimonas sp. 2012CJ34-2]MCL6270237.1 Holliday junction branch migration protein RuvA [Sansalvadorimonas sp. 2012CJ34-2]